MAGDRVLRAGPRDYFRCFLPDLTGSVTPSRPLPVTGHVRFAGSMREGIAEPENRFISEYSGLRQGADAHESVAARYHSNNFVQVSELPRIAGFALVRSGAMFPSILKRFGNQIFHV